MAEYLPHAHTILWFMAAFLALWGGSLIYRGVRARRPAGRRRCPSCKGAMAAGMTCAACGFAAEEEHELRARARDWWMIGSGALVQAFTVAAAYFGAGAYALVTRGYWGNPRDAVMTPWAGGGWGVLAFGALVAVIGYRGDRSSGRRRCPKCWYDMSGTVQGPDAKAPFTCPECGHRSRLRALYRPRRRWRAAAAGLLIMLASYGMFVVPHVRAGGWVGGAPTWLMIAGIKWIPEPMFEGGVPGAEEDYSLHGRTPLRNWTWQNWLIERWARGVTASESASPGSLRRALTLLDLDERSQTSVHVSIARGLTSESARRRIAAARAAQEAGNVGPDAVAALRPFLPALVRGVDDPDAQVAYICAIYLGHFGADADAAVPRLIEMLQSGVRDAQVYSAMSLRSIARQSVTARAAILKAMAALPGREGMYAAMAIGTPEAIGDECRAALVAMLTDETDEVAGWAAVALSRGKGDDPLVLEAILRQAESTRLQRARFVASADRFRGAGRPYALQLHEFLSDPDPGVRAAAAWVLGWWASEGLDLSLAEGALRSAMHDKFRSVRDGAEYALDEWRGWQERNPSGGE